jgi:hypothetical protein
MKPMGFAKGSPHPANSGIDQRTIGAATIAPTIRASPHATRSALRAARTLRMPRQASNALINIAHFQKTYLQQVAIER